MQELCDVGMLDRPVNFDFTHQFLLCPTPLKRGLLNNFGRAHCLRVHLYELVTLGEPTFSEEFALHILSVAHLSICVLYALLDELGRWVACISPSAWVKVCLTPTVGVARY